MTSFEECAIWVYVLHNGFWGNVSIWVGSTVTCGGKYVCVYSRHAIKCLDRQVIPERKQFVVPIRTWPTPIVIWGNLENDEPGWLAHLTFIPAATKMWKGRNGPVWNWTLHDHTCLCLHRIFNFMRQHTSGLCSAALSFYLCMYTCLMRPLIGGANSGLVR